MIIIIIIIGVVVVVVVVIGRFLSADVTSPGKANRMNT